ncbi:UNKNOWN [Stylonychia lemnae]|uniref:Uncharacterized protein n=1 Tax=Stylonychia lemnae TaxID=5949 RepID=A0A077ZSH0_STYLE|nr:UNKNOWN [Stylonychia lemnae]|eukprot:CDW71421.1 UNKNOWN [Stylonychia lemnae]
MRRTQTQNQSQEVYDQIQNLQNLGGLNCNSQSFQPPRVHASRYQSDLMKSNDKENIHPSGVYSDQKGKSSLTDKKEAGLQSLMNSTNRTPLKDITNQFNANQQQRVAIERHNTSLACLIRCTSWVLDVLDITNESQPIKKLTMHCYTKDQGDLLDDLIQLDQKGGIADSDLDKLMTPSISQQQYLSTVQTVFPVRNKAKTINTHIINFEFENDLNKSIQGYCHGQSIFTDELHYILKGSKIMKCCVEQMNIYRQKILTMPFTHQSHFLRKDQFMIKASNLPKSFGYKLSAPNIENQLYYSNTNSAHPRQLSNQHNMSQLQQFQINQELLAKLNIPIQQVNLGSSINTADIVRGLQEKLLNANVKQEKYQTNYQRFLSQIDINFAKHFKNKQLDHEDFDLADLTLQDLFDAFTEVSAFGLKVLYLYKGAQIRVDYALTLSIYQIHKRFESNQNQDQVSELSPQNLNQKFESPSIISPFQIPQFSTASSAKMKDTFYSYQETQPPHMRECFASSIEVRHENKEIDLSLKLKDLTCDSFFAVHYHQLKHLVISNPETSSNTVDLTQGFNPHASFLVYYRINSKGNSHSTINITPVQNQKELAQIPTVIGIICTKVEEYNFWASYQDENLDNLKTSYILKYKKVEFDERNRIVRNQQRIDEFLEEIGHSESDHFDLSFIKSKFFSSNGRLWDSRSSNSSVSH